MEKELLSIRELHRQSNGAYFGDFPDWLVVCTQHRDSEVLTRANFQAFRQLLEELSPENEEWAIEGSSHWLVGWVDHLLVAPNTPCHEKALEVLEAYADYPVIDETLYSQMETEETEQFWQSIGLRERIDYLNKHGESIFAARAQNASELYERAEETYYYVQRIVCE